MNKKELDRKNLVSELLFSFPKFAKESEGENVDLPYVLLGQFSDYLISGLLSELFLESEIEEAFSFLNRMAESNDLEVQNIAVVSVFEALADEDVAIKLAKKRLKRNGLRLFLKTVDSWQ